MQSSRDGGRLGFSSGSMLLTANQEMDLHVRHSRIPRTTRKTEILKEYGSEGMMTLLTFLAAAGTEAWGRRGRARATGQALFQQRYQIWKE